MERRRVAVLVFVVLLAAGCGAPRPEPGLFGRSDPDPHPTPAPVAATGPTTVLPVAGEATWTSNEGLGVTVRMAVHAVRRMPGATVLDWSITPLSATGQGSGDRVPGGVDLGLGGYGSGDARILLVDRDRATAYRPLISDTAEVPRCLCSPIWFAQSTLVIGRTRVLQLVFPALPADVTVVDVVAETAPPFWRVPVTPTNRVPQPTAPIDLARPIDERPPLGTTGIFELDRDPRLEPQRYIAYLDEVVTSDSFSSLRWTVQSLDGGTGLLGRLPIERNRNGEVFVWGSSADGPALRPAATRRSAADRRVTVRDVPAREITAQYVTDRRAGPRAAECLCSAIERGSDATRHAGGRVTLTTTYPPLPRGTSSVDVLFPGLPAVVGLPTTTAPNGSTRLGAPVPTGLPAPAWRYLVRQPPSGWEPSQWPTPLPDQDQLSAYSGVIERLR